MSDFDRINTIAAMVTVLLFYALIALVMWLGQHLRWVP